MANIYFQDNAWLDEEVNAKILERAASYVELLKRHGYQSSKVSVKRFFSSGSYAVHASRQLD